jgi:hypothetical protein
MFHFVLPNQWDLSHQIWSHPPMEGVGHAESDGAENYGSEMKFKLRYVEVGQIKGYLQGYVAWCRSMK